MERLKKLGFQINPSDLNNPNIKPGDVRVAFVGINKEEKKYVPAEKRLEDINISDIKNHFRLRENRIDKDFKFGTAEYNKTYQPVFEAYQDLKRIYSNPIDKINYINSIVKNYRVARNIQDTNNNLEVKNNANKVNSVDKSDEARESAKNGNSSITKVIAALGVAGLIALTAYSCGKSERKSIPVETKVQTEETVNEVVEEPKEEVAPVVEEEVVTPVKENVSVNFLDINYSNVSDFYNQITALRTNDSNFAKYFQSEDDVKNFINCVYKFSPIYKVETSINNIDMFDEIIVDYYDSCIRNGVEPKLNTIFEKDSFYQTKLSEAERVCYNLRNDLGTDYSVANEYYTFFAKNICDGRTAINQSRSENAPLVEALEIMFRRYYRSSAYAQRAAANQKNDVLPIDGIDPYYTVDTGITTNSNFSCPNTIKENIIMRIRPNSTEWIDKEVLSNGEGLNSENIVYEHFNRVLGQSLSR